MIYKWIAVFIVIILIIMILISVVEYTPSKEGEPARLGFIWQRKSNCLGKLNISSKTSNGGCRLKGSITLTNCEDKEWSLIKGVECDDMVIHKGKVDNPEFEETYNWREKKGSYTFVLCVDRKVRATSSMTC